MTTMARKNCATCGEPFDYERKPGQPPKTCSDECREARHRATRRRWREDPERKRERIKRVRDLRRELIDALKDVPCADCGERYPPYVMDFDHRDPAQKSFRLGNGPQHSEAAIRAEAAKCDVVCANCHRERTHGSRG